jgi:pimeloyl-ACP methyl ester carboxylesterase
MPEQSASHLTAAPEDRHVAVDSDLLHLRIAGARSTLPPIVLEAGNGSVIESWGLVAQHLEPHTRVLSYERAGVGSSEGTGAECTKVAARLAGLLQSPPVKRQLGRPVILAGHSLGGLYARYFAATHPEDVVALVMIDTTPDDVVMPKGLLRISYALLWGVYLLTRTGIPQWWLRRKSDPDARPGFTEASLKALARAHHIRAVQAETQVLHVTQKEVAAQGLPKGIPVLCVSAGQRPRIVRDAIVPFQRYHDHLASAGTPPLSRHHCIQAATHMSLLSNPAHAEILGRLILEFAYGISQSHTPAAGAEVPA